VIKMAFVKVVSANDLQEGSGKSVSANGKALALFKVEGKLYAIDNTCAHRGGPLGEGMLEGNVVTCPWHGWRYDISNGKCLTLPVGVKSYTVKIDGKDVLVDV
jgi:nitrite reductase/ring-hydroxylating ferredoxin subunit